MNETGAVLEPSARLEEVAPRLLAELLRRCGEARIRVAGTSMLPLIRPGDVLLVRSLDILLVERDDVIVFTEGARLFAHRVVRVERRESGSVLITRGDMHDHDDPPVTESQFLGRIEGQMRDARIIASSRARFHRQRASPSGAWITSLRRAMHRGAQAVRSIRGLRADDPAVYSPAPRNHFGAPRTIRSR